MLSVDEETVQIVSGLLAAERRRRGPEVDAGRWAATGRRCWFLDGTQLAQLACDHRIGRSTAYRYLHEGIDALGGLADRRPRAVTLDARR